MDTNDPTKLKPSLWLPETNVYLVSAIGKLGEEAAELSNICHRIIIQGFAQSDPETRKPNRQALLEEMADVRAMSKLARDVIQYPLTELTEFERRSLRKLAMKTEWLNMIVAHRGDKDFFYRGEQR